MYKLNFKVLFFFENEKVAIIEIRRNNTTDNDPAKVYQWLVYDKINDMLSKLDFKSMQSTDNKEYRTFESEALEFDKKSAIYTENGKKQILNIVSNNTLPTQLKEAIGDFLLLENFRSERI